MSSISNSQRIDSIRHKALISGVDFEKEHSSVYLARAVSSVPDSEKEHLEHIFEEIVSAVKESGLEPLLPVELGDIDLNGINSNNHKQLLQSKIVLSLTYATSDGRGWEMGYSYGSKLLVPIVLQNQKINIPTLRLPYQIPIEYTNKKDLTNLLKALHSFTDISFGTLHGKKTVIGDNMFDLREIASDYVPVISYLI